MTVDTNTMVSITEANQNFSKVARLVDELGSVVILKNNAPRYLVIDFSKADESAVAKDEDVLEISKRLLAQNKEAYEEQYYVGFSREYTEYRGCIGTNDFYGAISLQSF